MGGAKDWMIEIEQERRRKEESLLESPQVITSASRRINYLSDDVEKHGESIEEIRRLIASANSWRTRIADHIVGGIVGIIVTSVVAIIASGSIH